ncbi:branched-chain amino acid ABC transporter permease [Actinoplanes lobatus]|uniref:Branched-chain amino acid ABC transporter permease n=1 Tax=Actinoplanes lobatus TaxID=113568 RepID=A0A7W7HFF1_9ACTN|nr:branched-chain amino acid ABC transporter permease [Actinoplanes lobatus]MBB4749529.1 branched-chain amino acid transport system permease protein [Actinoplanes lobatus]GGN77831.1 branched-chain amino acid ABC transporter permease [Actinoplanes lobatus]GIE38266.1 branched-chain amino acid ABC transporter permease [Actinoplanes lobatus]
MNFDELFGHLGQHTVDGLSKGAIYALVALGYTLVYGVLKLINFAHSEVFMVGTFAVLGTWTALGATSNPSVGMMILFLLAGLVAGAVASGATAVGVELIAYRRLRRMNAPPLIFLITAIGLSLVLSEAFGLWQGRLIKGMPTIVEREVLFTIGNTEITNTQLLTIVSALVMMVLLDVFINRTRYGRGVRAVAQNPDTAALMGVNKDRVILLIFLLGGLLAGAAALLYNVRYGNTRFNVGFLLGLKAFTAAVLGGIGNLRGALLGGLLLGVVEVYAATLTQSNWEDVAAFVVLVVVLLFRPTGLLGESLGRARA